MRALVCFVVLFMSVLSFASGQGKSANTKKAVKFFEQAKVAYEGRQFDKSLGLLNQVLAADPGFIDAYLMKSDIYQDLDSIAPQIQAFESALKLTPDKNTGIYFLLGRAYFRTGKYVEAEKSFVAYLDKAGANAPHSAKAKENLFRCSAAIALVSNPVPFNAVSLGAAVNTDDDEYWPSITLDGKTLVFTRLVGSSTGQPLQNTLIQEDFYTSQLVDGQWQPSEPLVQINTNLNEGAQSISADGKLLFFTACNRQGGLGGCDIYYSENQGGSWSLPRNIGSPVNSPYWESQPSVQANGRSLYFVSNRPGGKGGMDIWMSKLKGYSSDGARVWGKPINLGDSINTPGNEMSPFIHPDGKTLYFASDYWPGLGGSDLFYSRLSNDSVWSSPRNMGYPVNSASDEQGLVVDASGENAYFSSNRPGSKGKDIYTFKLYDDARPAPVSYIKGRVTDDISGAAVSAQIELIDIEGGSVVAQAGSDREQGEFLLCLPLGHEYAFNVSATGYLFYSAHYQLKEQKSIADPVLLEIKLKKIEVGHAMVLRNVFFETGSFHLLPTSLAELRKAIDFMTDNKTISIEIEGHTDNVGNDAMNKTLSEARAKAVFDYLVDNGIDSNRMRYKGYGMSKPIATNETSEGRSLNRRTEFRIIKN